MPIEKDECEAQKELEGAINPIVDEQMMAPTPAPDLRAACPAVDIEIATALTGLRDPTVRPTSPPEASGPGGWEWVDGTDPCWAWILSDPDPQAESPLPDFSADFGGTPDADEEFHGPDYQPPDV